VSCKCVRVYHMPSLSLLICRGRTAPLLRLGSPGGCIGYASCSVLRCICPRVVMSSSLPTVPFLGLFVLRRLLCPVRAGEPGICVVFGSILLRFLLSRCLPVLKGGDVHEYMHNAKLNEQSSLGGCRMQ